MSRHDKSTFLRALALFNPSVSKPSSDAARGRIAESIDHYEKTSGGTWNYESLYTCVRSVLKGLPLEQARKSLESCVGSGETEAKTGLFDQMHKSFNLTDVDNIDVEATTVQVNEVRAITLSPDFAFRGDDVITEVFVYPKADPPLKRIHQDMIVAVLAQPKHLAKDKYRFCMVEYPKIDGVRRYRMREFGYEYRTISKEFLDHMAAFLEELDRNNAQGDLF